MTIGNKSAQNLSDLWRTPLPDRFLYGLSTGNVTHVILDTRPSRFSHATSKSWVGPGDEAIQQVDLLVHDKLDHGPGGQNKTESHDCYEYD